MMTKDEIMSKNINLTFDFIDYLIKNPSEAEKIPNGSRIVFEETIQGNIHKNKLKKDNVLIVRKVYEFGIN